MSRKGKPVLRNKSHTRHALRQRRIEKGLTLAELGNRVGLSESGMSLIESGDRALSLKRALLLASVLDMPVEELDSAAQEVSA